jgi:hypothetical protein
LLVEGTERERQISGLKAVRQRLIPEDAHEIAPKASPITRVADTVVRLLSTMPVE